MRELKLISGIAGDTQSRQRRKSWILDRPLAVAFTAFLATLLPLLLFLRRFPRLAPFAMDAGDVFYYLTVARNSLHTHFYSFDGILPTNGFHPVWQLLLYQAMSRGLLTATNSTEAISRLFLGNIFILSVAAALLANYCAEDLKNRWLALLAICPGLLWFGIAPSAPVYVSIWSFANGMETSLELLVLALALTAFQRTSRSGPGAFLTSFLFGLLVLTRLDDIFFLIPILILLYWTSDGGKLQRACLIGLPVAMIGAYLIYNRLTVGIWMPVSGAAKSGISIVSNLEYVSRIFIPRHWDTFGSTGGGTPWSSEIFMRTYQMIVPMIVCAVFLFRRRRSMGLLEALCYGVLMKGAYNLFNVQLFDQGFWYYGTSIFVANLVIVIWFDKVLQQLYPRMASRKGQLLTAVVAILTVSASFNIYINQVIARSQAEWMLSILDRGALLRAMVERHGAERFIEMNDGILAYATGLPALSGQALVLDPEAEAALSQHRFFDLAVKRHYTLLMAAGMYVTLIDNAIASHGTPAQTGLFKIAPQELNQYALQPIDADPVTGTKLYRITPRKADGQSAGSGG